MTSVKTWLTVTGITSLLCGLMVAAGAGGAPLWALYATVIIVAAAAAAVAWSNRGRRHADEGYFSSRSTDDVSVSTHDAALSSLIFDILRPTDVEWVRNETFATSWHGARIVPFRRLLRDHDLFDLSVGVELGTGPGPEVGNMLRAVEGFLALYDATTYADPMLRGGDWQVVQGSDSAGQQAEAQQDVVSRCEDLREAASAVALAYDDLPAYSPGGVPVTRRQDPWS